jgi:hypothetical protein
MWELGDVFEVFLVRRGWKRYVELHTTPRNHRLHLAWTQRDLTRFQTGRASLGEFVRSSKEFTSWVRRSTRSRQWRVLLRIPSSTLPPGTPLQAGQRFFMSFSRYDAGLPSTCPILSSTSFHSQPDYHRIHEWRPVILGS